MNRKSIIVALLTVLSLGSCSKSLYYQVYETRPASDNISVRPDGVVYSDADLDVTYNFWSENGQVNFLITNKSENILYVDLTRSSFVHNGVAYDYYLYRTTSESVSNYVSVSESNGVTTKGMAAAIPAPRKFLYSQNGSVSAGTGQTQSVEYEQPKIVPIPPHSSKAFGVYSINDRLWKSDNMPLFFDEQDPTPECLFMEDNSPLKFTNFISYKLSENGELRSFSNMFYVNRIYNVKENETTVEGVPVTSPRAAMMKERRVTTISIAKPENFYIKYMRK